MQKLRFDARTGPTEKTADMYDNPSMFSFVHNFKVHFKRGVLQGFANKLDISMASSSAELPSTEQVLSEFNDRMKASVVASDTKHRFSQASYHVTQVEYKQSIAFYDSKSLRRVSIRNVPEALPYRESEPGLENWTPLPGLCMACGASVPSDSSFCNKCGSPIA